MAPMMTNDEKARLWQAYRDRKPYRAPVTYGVNPRVVVLDPRWNPKGVTFADYFTDAAALVEMQLAFMEYTSGYLNQYGDSPVGRPGAFEFYVDSMNSYDSLYFGAPIHFRDGELPDTAPILQGADKERIFRLDIEHPLDNPFIRRTLARHEALKTAAASLSYHGMSFSVRPPLMGFDGHLTIATCLRGQELYTDFYEDPPYVRRLLEFIHRGVVLRNTALAEAFGVKAFSGPNGGFADDSIQLISTEMYREFLLPLHRRWYAQWSAQGPHSIHLCGDATRHFPAIRRELNVTSFDTGFPVDHGALRRALGPDVEILGGPPVGLLLHGTPDEVYRRTRDILRSGVLEGGRFILREANNLPPRCPEENLAAMYRCCLEHGNIA